MAERKDWNRAIIDEFQANGGKVGGPFEHQPLLLLTHTGAKTGQRRTNPLAYLADGDRYVIFASKAGAPTNPDWYHNLVANPAASIEVGTQTLEVEAEVARGDERERLWTEQVRRNSGFADYESKSGRSIPVIILRPKA